MSAPTVAIGDIVDVRGGGTPSKSNAAFWTGDIPWVSPKDMKLWEIFDSEDKITKEAIDSSATNLIPRDAILVVNRSGILKHTLPVGITRKSVAINQDLKALVCGPKVIPDYLARMVKAAEPIVLKWVRATTADNFSIENLRSLHIPLPPLDQQRRIAAILDKADALRRKRKRALDLLDSLTRSIFLEMFGDVTRGSCAHSTVSFTEACRDGTSQCEKVQRGDYLSTGSFPVIDQGQKPIGGWIDDRKLLTKILSPVVVFGDHTRSVKYIDFDFVVGADGAKVLIPTKKFEALFFSYLLRMMPIPNLGYSRHMRALKEMRFICPPMEHQERFSLKAKQIFTQSEEAVVQSLKMDDLITSLQARAFLGQL